ncbi:secreted antigen 1 [Babesia divergens]|uniref:Secreted antigen 1 n=1 Tax=Babesia divergens TaxID=32595 RepID=A0AAD9GAW0_BABDI|nr:secreted antigen 1 [Babesia divergens]
MGLMGILRASVLCLALAAFHGQPVSCGLSKSNKKPKKDSNAKVSEISGNLKDSTVKVRNLSSLDRAKELGVLSPKEYEEFDVIDGKLIKKPEAANQISEDIPVSAIDPNFPVFTPEEDEDALEESSKVNESDVSKKSKDSTVKPQVVEDALEESSKVNEFDVSEKPKESTVKYQEPSVSSVHGPEYGLVFKNSTWDDSQLASAVLFIKEFCKDVNEKKFKNQMSYNDSKNLSLACAYVFHNLMAATYYFTPKYGPGSLDERKEIHEILYEGTLQPEEFHIYIDWLKKHISEVGAAYVDMFEEAGKLTEEQLKTDTSVGPLKYGFVFTRGLWKHYSLREHFKELTKHCLAGMRQIYNHRKLITKSFKRKHIEKPNVVEEPENDETEETL